jgi:LmbE family N-acetylglucosaminyl deacetylase
LTHRVDVRRHLDAKRAALAAHASQSTGASMRTVAVLLRLPSRIFRRVLGTEWFVEVGRAPGPLCDDVFDSLRGADRS